MLTSLRGQSLQKVNKVYSLFTSEKNILRKELRKYYEYFIMLTKSSTKIIIVINHDFIYYFPVILFRSKSFNDGELLISTTKASLKSKVLFSKEA